MNEKQIVNNGDEKLQEFESENATYKLRNTKKKCHR